MSATARGGVFTLSAPNAAAFHVSVSRFVGDAFDLRPIADEIFASLESIAEEQHASEETAAGEWTPLSERYAAWKRERYRGPKGAHFPNIMTLTGATHASLAGKTGESIRIAERYSLTYGTTVNRGGQSYPLFHQRGDAPLPQRQLISPPPPGVPVPERWRFFGRIVQREAVRLARAKLAAYIAEAKVDERANRQQTFDDTSVDAG